MTRRERKQRIAAEHQMDLAAEAKRKACYHRNAVEVTNSELGRVAWWCEECETQLPPEFDPKGVSKDSSVPSSAPITGTPFLVQSPLGIVEVPFHDGMEIPPDMEVTPQRTMRKRSEQGFILHQTAVGQPVEPLRPAVQRVWEHHIQDATAYTEAAMEHNAEYLAALQARVPGIEKGWTVQSKTACPPDQKLEPKDIADMTLEEYKALASKLQGAGLMSRSRGIFD